MIRWADIVDGMVNANNATEFARAKSALLGAFESWLPTHTHAQLLTAAETRLAARELLFLRMMDARTLKADATAHALLTRLNAELASRFACVRAYHDARTVVLARLARIYATGAVGRGPHELVAAHDAARLLASLAATPPPDADAQFTPMLELMRFCSGLLQTGDAHLAALTARLVALQILSPDAAELEFESPALERLVATYAAELVPGAMRLVLLHDRVGLQMFGEFVLSKAVVPVDSTGLQTLVQRLMRRIVAVAASEAPAAELAPSGSMADFDAFESVASSNSRATLHRLCFGQTQGAANVWQAICAVFEFDAANLRSRMDESDLRTCLALCYRAVSSDSVPLTPCISIAAEVLRALERNAWDAAASLSPTSMFKSFVERTRLMYASGDGDLDALHEAALRFAVHFVPSLAPDSGDSRGVDGLIFEQFSAPDGVLDVFAAIAVSRLVRSFGQSAASPPPFNYLHLWAAPLVSRACDGGSDDAVACLGAALLYDVRAFTQPRRGRPLSLSTSSLLWDSLIAQLKSGGDGAGDDDDDDADGGRICVPGSVFDAMFVEGRPFALPSSAHAALDDRFTEQLATLLTTVAKHARSWATRPSFARVVAALATDTRAKLRAGAIALLSAATGGTPESLPLHLLVAKAPKQHRFDVAEALATGIFGVCEQTIKESNVAPSPRCFAVLPALPAFARALKPVSGAPVAPRSRAALLEIWRLLLVLFTTVEQGIFGTQAWIVEGVDPNDVDHDAFGVQQQLILMQTVAALVGDIKRYGIFDDDALELCGIDDATVRSARDDDARRATTLALALLPLVNIVALNDENTYSELAQARWTALIQLLQQLRLEDETLVTLSPACTAAVLRLVNDTAMSVCGSDGDRQELQSLAAELFADGEAVDDASPLIASSAKVPPPPLSPSSPSASSESLEKHVAMEEDSLSAPDDENFVVVESSSSDSDAADATAAGAQQQQQQQPAVQSVSGAKKRQAGRADGSSSSDDDEEGTETVEDQQRVIADESDASESEGSFLPDSDSDSDDQQRASAAEHQRVETEVANADAEEASSSVTEVRIDLTGESPKASPVHTSDSSSDDDSSSGGGDATNSDEIWNDRQYAKLLRQRELAELKAERELKAQRSALAAKAPRTLPLTVAAPTLTAPRAPPPSLAHVMSKPVPKPAPKMLARPMVTVPARPPTVPVPATHDVPATHVAAALAAVKRVVMADDNTDARDVSAAIKAASIFVPKPSKAAARPVSSAASATSGAAAPPKVIDMDYLRKRVLSWSVREDLSGDALGDEGAKKPADTFASVTAYRDAFLPLLLIEFRASVVSDLEECDFGAKTLVASVCDFKQKSWTFEVDLQFDRDGHDDVHTQSLLVIYPPKMSREAAERSGAPASVVPDWSTVGDHALAQVLEIKRPSKQQSRGSFVARVCLCMPLPKEHTPAQRQRLQRMLELLSRNGDVCVTVVGSMATMVREFDSLANVSDMALRHCLIDPRANKPDIVEFASSGEVPAVLRGANRMQMQIVRHVLSVRRGFTLVQGPPGTGKTRTIVMLLEALLRASTRSAHSPAARNMYQAAFACPRVLVCAPSNAAVDEIMSRIIVAHKIGTQNPLNAEVVRIGQVSDAFEKFSLTTLANALRNDQTDNSDAVKALEKQRGDLGCLMDTIEKFQRDVIAVQISRASTTMPRTVPLSRPPPPPPQQQQQQKHEARFAWPRAVRPSEAIPRFEDLMRTEDEEDEGGGGIVDDAVAQASTSARGRDGKIVYVDAIVFVRDAIELFRTQFNPLDERDGDAVVVRFYRAVKDALTDKSSWTVVDEALRSTLRSIGHEKKQVNERLQTLRSQLDEQRSRYAEERETNVLRNAKMVFSTLSSSGIEAMERASRAGLRFETVIIDEAGQAVEPSTLVPLRHGAQRCVLVGDPQQLPPTVISKTISEIYSRSLFERISKSYDDAARFRLVVQYRMHPAIRRFPSNYFYDGSLRDGDNIANPGDHSLTPAYVLPVHDDPLYGVSLFFDVQHGREARGGYNRMGVASKSLANDDEVDCCRAIYCDLVAKYPAMRAMSFMIMSPYQAQVQKLKRAFQPFLSQHRALRVITVDAAQGSECDVVLLSCVRASTSGIGFVGDVRRINVAVTRSRTLRIVVGTSSALQQSPAWRALLGDATAPPNGIRRVSAPFHLDAIRTSMRAGRIEPDSKLERRSSQVATRSELYDDDDDDDNDDDNDNNADDNGPPPPPPPTQSRTPQTNTGQKRKAQADFEAQRVERERKRTDMAGAAQRATAAMMRSSTKPRAAINVVSAAHIPDND
jgi:hypothetical protein